MEQNLMELPGGLQSSFIQMQTLKSQALKTRIIQTISLTLQWEMCHLASIRLPTGSMININF